MKASHHLPLRPGTNVAVVTALAHVIVTEGLMDEAFIRERCDWDEFQDYAAFVSDPRHAPEATEMLTGVPAADLREAAKLFATGGNGAIYYGLGVTEHSQGSTTVMSIANLAMLTGNMGRPGVGVNPLRGQNNVQGACDMGSFPHELPGYRHVKNDDVRDLFKSVWGVENRPGTGPAHSQHAGCRRGWHIQGAVLPRRRTFCNRPDTKHVAAGLCGDGLRDRPRPVPERDRELRAMSFLPGSTFLEKDGTFTNAERRINRVREVMKPRKWLCRLGDYPRCWRTKMGAKLVLHAPPARSWTKSR